MNSVELRVYDKNLMPLGVVDEIESLIWTPTYWAEGTVKDVQLLAPMTANNKKLLVKGNILILHDGAPEFTDNAGNWRRAAEIKYRHISENNEGAEQIEVNGWFLKKWLSKRVVLDKIVMTGTAQEKINRIVTENHGSGADARRQFPNFSILEQKDLGGTSSDYASENLIDAGLEVYNRAVAGKLGYDILVNENAQQYGFWLYKGKSFTAVNSDGNSHVVFSKEYDNVVAQEYTESDEGKKNVAYIKGAEDEAGAVPWVEIDQDAAVGLDRDEVCIDKSVISRTYTENDVEITIPEEEYLRILAAAGADSLEDYGETMAFSAVLNVNSNLKYGEDYNIGDRVSCMEKNWGIRIDVRIMAASITYQNGIKEIEATLGESLPTLLQQIRKVR